MPPSRILCYITDRSQFAGDEAVRERRLLDKIREAAGCGVDYIQLREKDLSTRELERLAGQAVRIIREQASGSGGSDSSTQPRPRLLINSRVDVAVAIGADGVNLRSNDISAIEARGVWSEACARTGNARSFVIGVSCHSVDEVAHAAADGADFALFAPVFEKRVFEKPALEKKNSPQIPAAGLQNLRTACQQKIPVLALGGIGLENARSCFEAGAAGIAAIRLFQENDIRKVVQTLRGL